MLVKALEKIIINGAIVDVGETYDGAAEELDAYISGGYVEVLEQDEDAEDDRADNQNEEVDQEVDQEDEEPEETPKEKPKTTRKTVRRTKKTGA
ncbi:MAG: hypothetical protein HXL70_07490 [Dialister invisus]|uniref:Uncharacterized protein n=1 Tax=Dialister invisus TaxID=218538 RepID=A0A930BB51_9FIRM|nr:hypothetical protein [Dialister invisus]